MEINGLQWVVCAGFQDRFRLPEDIYGKKRKFVNVLFHIAKCRICCSHTVSFILCLVFLDSVSIVDPIVFPQGYWSFGCDTYMNPGRSNISYIAHIQSAPKPRLLWEGRRRCYPCTINIAGTRLVNKPFKPHLVDSSINFPLQYDYLIEKCLILSTNTIRNTRTAMNRY